MAYFHRAICCCWFITLTVYGADIKDMRPGSRSIYVKNHPEESEKKPDILYLGLRNTCCCNNGQEPPRPKSACMCFVDASLEDQPAIQGDAGIVLGHYERYGQLFPGCDLIHDKSTGQPLITIPSPDLLLRFFKILEIGDQFEFMSGAKLLGIDDYLQLLTQMKLPISRIPEPHEVEDKSMLYHFYFHDLFNHVFFWVAFPPSLKNLISKRVEKFLKITSTLERNHSDDTALINLIKLLKFVMASEFDTSQGSANNHFFNGNIEKLTKFLEQMLNFGFYFLNKQDEVSVSFDEGFLIRWTINQGRSIKRSFKKCVRQNNESLFYIMPSLYKNYEARMAFQNLFLLKNADEVIEETYWKLLKLMASHPDISTDDAFDGSIYLEDLIREIDTRWKGILKKAQEREKTLYEYFVIPAKAEARLNAITSGFSPP